jgi:predicted nucleic acid-binding protein
VILVARSVWIAFFSHSPGIGGAELRRLIEHAAPLALTGVIVTEILPGLTRASSLIERCWGMWETLEPNGFATYRQAATIFRPARAKGVRRTTLDSLIAATAIEHHAPVFTLDKDFSRITRISALSLYKIPATRP